MLLPSWLERLDGAIFVVFIFGILSSTYIDQVCSECLFGVVLIGEISKGEVAYHDELAAADTLILVIRMDADGLAVLRVSGGPRRGAIFSLLGIIHDFFQFLS